MAFLDHEGGSEFPYSQEEVISALAEAIPTVPGLEVDTIDRLGGRVVAKAGMSLFSWGENIPISVVEIVPGRSRVSVLSTPKTGIFGGGALDLGKNRRNIENILTALSGVLSRRPRSQSVPSAVRSQPAEDEKECPFCAETIKSKAIKCRFCGSNLT